MNEDIQTVVNTAIAKMPQWLRHDLASKDAAARERAEEALAAMIASALAEPARNAR